jgi:hypothetical protein
VSGQSTSGGGQGGNDAQAGGPAQARDASSIAPDKRAHLLTSHAQEAVNAAELINSAFKKRTLGSAVPRRLEVAPPSGPSTSGGKKARQPITLVQPALQAPAVMIGFLDVAQKSAGLRDYELVARQYEGRFRASFETTKDEYQALCRDLTGMLETLGFGVVADEPREDERVTAPPTPAANKQPFYIAAGVLALAVLVVLLTRC